MAAELPVSAFMRSLWHDLRYAFRGLRRSPGFPGVAIALLALGTGANTAVFTVVHAVLLRPLPYPHPEQLALMVRSADAAQVTVPEYQFWKEHASSYQSAAAYRGAIDREFDSGGTLEWIKAKPVTAGFLRTVGVALAFGREFTEEEASPDGPQAIILTDSLWRSALGGREDAIGQIVKLDGASYTVVGILPSSFWLPQSAGALVPLRFSGTIEDSGINTSMIARLKPGIDLRQAEAERAPLTQSFLQTRPRYLSRGYRGLGPVSYQDWLTGRNNGDLRTILLALLGAVFLLLVIACSNLAGLLLARFAGRRKEIAVRLALGSNSGRLLRQLLLENILIGAIGGLAGLLCAAWLLEGLLALMPFPQIPVSSPIRLNLPVLSFALTAAIGANLLLSFAPLLASSRVGIVEALKSGNPQSGVRLRMRGVLVAGQVAISVALSISAALLVQSLYRLHQERLGFSPKGLMTFWTPTAVERRGKPEELRRFNAVLLDRLRNLPSVRSAAAVNMLPLVGPNNFPTQREGHPEQSIGGMEIRAVTPDYFQTMGTHVLYGRAFTEEDKEGSAPVILVSKSVAARWWGQVSPIGDRVVIGLFQGRSFGNDPPRQVVGLVEDAKRLSLKEPSPPTVYVPLAQWEPAGVSWALRGDFSPVFANELRQAIKEIDPRQRVERVRTMEAAIASSTADSRFDAWLFGLFATLALALTTIGIYGMLAFSVARRTHEIGTRIALGATPARVLRLVLKQGATPVAFGLVAGVAGALGLTRLLSNLLFHVYPTDWPAYAAVLALVLAVGALASVLPARRAMKVDPLIALRSE